MGKSHDKVRIKARGQAKRHRINGAKTVNDIRTEEQRNVQTGVVHGKMLICVRSLSADGVEH